jgi:hypothetical protein
MTVKQVFNTSAELDFPNVLPTLDLDFANSKTLDPRITFTRSSGGSYLDQNGLIRYAGINEARFDHDPETGESLGLLIEEQRTNLLAWSQDFNQWTKHRDGAEPSTITVTESDELAPDGISKFFLCTYGLSDLRRAFSGGAGKTYTASCFYKIPNQPNASNVAAFEVHITGGVTSVVQITYNFSQNRVTRFQRNVPGTFGFKKYPNGVVRLWLTITDNGTGNSVFFLNLRGIQTNQSILTWGAQIEEGTFPTSYIPTLGSTRTRAVDFARIIGKNFSEFYNQSEGTIFSEAKGVANIFGGNTRRYWEISRGGSGNNRFLSGYNSSILVRLLVVKDGLTSASITETNQNPFNNSVKVATSFANNYYRLYSNNLYGNPVNSGILPIVDRIDLGGTSNNAGAPQLVLNGTISRLTYFPKRLPNSQLQALTS